MAEILAHPWLEGQTPGITYVPAPPVSELAKPLPSALHIDRDLFESLCVIWGRHADVESIQLDLLSPAGHGTLAKAFYFLLQKHREQAMEEHGILMDIDQVLNTAGKVITKQYAAPRSKPGRHSLDLARGAPAIPVSSLLRSERPAPPPPSRTPSPKPRLAITTNVQAPTRPHPPSPVGPRPQKPRPHASRNSAVLTNPPSFVPNPDITRARSQTMGPMQVGRDLHHPRSMPPPIQRRTATVDSAAAQRSSMHSTYGGSSTSRASYYGVPHPGVIHAPVPVPAAAKPVLPLLSHGVGRDAAQGSPMLTTPRCPDVEMQDQTHPYAATANSQWNASDGDRMLPPRIARPERRPSVDGGRRNWSTSHDSQSGWSKPTGSENKENRLAPGTRTSQPDSVCTSGGLGFGHSIPLAREMGNVLFIQDNGYGQQQHPSKKSGKGRRTYLRYAVVAGPCC